MNGAPDENVLMAADLIDEVRNPYVLHGIPLRNAAHLAESVEIVRSHFGLLDRESRFARSDLVDWSRGLTTEEYEEVLTE